MLCLTLMKTLGIFITMATHCAQRWNHLLLSERSVFSVTYWWNINSGSKSAALLHLQPHRWSHWWENRPWRCTAPPFMLLQHSNQPYTLKKTFIHIDISTLLFIECIILINLFLHWRMWVNLRVCICTRAPPHEPTPSVWIHAPLVNEAHVLKDTSSVSACSLEYFFVKFHIVRATQNPNRKGRKRKARKTERKKNPNVRSGLSGRRTRVAGNIEFRNT